MIKNRIIFGVLLIFLLLILAVCESNNTKRQNGEAQKTMLEKSIVKEAFHTDRDEGDNVDSPAFWKGENGEYWLLATAKEGNAIIVYDARNGKFIRRFDDDGAFSRPNGIAVIDDLLLVVERDNHRISIFNLPEFSPVGIIGEKELKRPYGIAINFFDDQYHMYITDNYETETNEIPPASQLGERVQYFTFSLKDGKLESKHIRAFGDTEGEGVLYKVESIFFDRELQRLLIAEELEEICNIKIYSPDGKFKGVVIPNDYFHYEPEGIALFACEQDTSGYYIITDQSYTDNSFRVFDRKSLEYIGSFGGEITSNTDGVVLTQETVGTDYPYGVFYPVHDDGSVTAIDWSDIAAALNLRKSCY